MFIPPSGMQKVVVHCRQRPYFVKIDVTVISTDFGERFLREIMNMYKCQTRLRVDIKICFLKS